MPGSGKSNGGKGFGGGENQLTSGQEHTLENGNNDAKLVRATQEGGRKCYLGKRQTAMRNRGEGDLRYDHRKRD